MSRLPPPLAIRLLATLSLMMSTLTALAQTPAEILVRNTNNQIAYIDGKTSNLGSLRLGVSRSMSFTITNQGEQPLTGLALTVDGDHPEDYVITQGLTQTELTIGTSTTFTLEFKPTATGIRTATLHIANNDADEGPFDIPFYGEGSTPEIQVVDPAGNEILQGGSYSYGSRQWSSQGTRRQFVVKNAGVGALKISNTTSTGANANDFDIYFGLGGEEARPGADLGLNVIFNPLSYGPRTATITITSDDEDEGTFQFTVTGTGSMPGFQAEQVENTPLVNDAIVPLGASGVDEPTGKPVTFTIKNPGNRPLNLGASFLGGNAADFSITSAPASTLQAGQSTTITALFVPSATGIRETRLTLHHNATLSGATTPFYIRLRGQGVYSEIKFESDVFTARHGDTQGLVKLTRTEASVPVTVELRLEPGVNQAVPPFKPAQPDVDYTPLTEQTSVISFAPGEAEKTISVPLLAPASGAKINRHLRLHLQNFSPGADWSPPNAAHLLILGADTTKPTLTLTTPAAGKVSAAFPLLVSGKAGDAMGIDRVEVKVDNAEPVQALLSASTSSSAVPFNVEFPLSDGLHDLVVTAYDLRGNSTSVSRTINYSHRRKLFLALSHGYDEARPGGGATLSLSATPTSAATQIQVNGLVRTVAVIPGTKLKISAKVKSQVLFNSWDYNTTADVSSLQASRLGNELTVTMPDEDLYVTAHLAQGSYAVTEGVSQSLYWQLTPDGTPGASVSNVAGIAHLSGTLTATGAFSGKLLTNGLTVPVAASFYVGEMAAFTVAGKKRASLPYPGGELTIHGHQNNFLANITPSDVSVAPMYSSPQRGSSSVPKTYCTLLLDAPAPQSTTTPAAPGYATLNRTNTGLVTLAGVLADGTTITQSTALLANLQVYPFIQLPTPGGKTKLGLLHGSLQMAPWSGAFGGEAAFDTTLQWHRPAAASPNVLLYPAGWPAGLTLEVEGAPYAPGMTAQSALFGITLKEPSPARLYFTGGKLTAPIEKSYLGIMGNTVVKLAPVDNSYTLKIVPATGLFSGTFTPNWSNPSSAKPTFKGVILQKGPSTATGFFINNAKGEPAPESGSVTLGPPAQ